MSARNWWRALPAVAWFAAVMLSAQAQAQMAADHPLSDVRTVRQLLTAHPKDDLHIVLIHGIRTDDRTTWDQVRPALCGHLGGLCGKAQFSLRRTDTLQLKDKAPRADYFGTGVWADDTGPGADPARTGKAKWLRSQPFVDHYMLTLTDGRRLFVDEINWWPLALAFKCQFIVPSEADLVGPDKTNIGFCAADDDIHYPWLTQPVAGALLASHPISAGAPSINAMLKNQIMDWGISDAVLSLGTLKTLLREAVRCAFTDIAAETAADFPSGNPILGRTHDCEKDEAPGASAAHPDGRFVIISHSLGAFLLMDTFVAAAADSQDYPLAGGDQCRFASTAATVLKAEDSQAFAERVTRSSQSLCFVVAESGQLYFLANQFPLLELARTQISSRGTSDEPTGSSFVGAIDLWAQAGDTQNGPKQIVAFSDPGDILTFKVPNIGSAEVINAYPHNFWRGFGLFEWPPSAHVNYLTNPKVLSVVFGG